MIQQQTMLDIADNTGAKEVMCIKVLGGARRRTAGLGDVIICSVKNTLPTSEVKKKAVVRRAKLYYLRDRVGKKAFTLKERQLVKETTGRKRSRVKARKEKQAAATAETTAKPEAKVRKARVRQKKEAGES